MSEFIDIIFSFPTVVFTFTTVVFLGFWSLTSLIGAGADALEDVDVDFDTDVDLEVDPDADFEIDSLGESSLVKSALHFLGVGRMPLLLGLNLQSLFAWLASVVAMTFLNDIDSGLVRGLVGVVVLIASFLFGVAVTRAIAGKFEHFLKPTPALRQRDLVGSTCTVTTARVTADFGQAEVRDAEGGSLIVQVRCAKDNDLGAGDRALIFDHERDSGIFQISPDRSLAT